MVLFGRRSVPVVQIELLGGRATLSRRLTIAVVALESDTEFGRTY